MFSSLHLNMRLYLGGVDALEEGVATHSSILTWRIPWTEEPGELESVGLQRVGHNWSDLALGTWGCGFQEVHLNIMN